MMMARPCVPPDIKALGEEAEKRRDAAIDRLLRKLHDAIPPKDELHRALVALIAADERKDR